MMYALYLYFLGLGFRNTSRALEPFAERSHIAVWQWVQRFDPKQVWISAIQHHIAGEMWRKVEIIDEVGKWFKVSCEESLYLCRSFRFSCHFQISSHTTVLLECPNFHCRLASPSSQFFIILLIDQVCRTTKI